MNEVIRLLPDELANQIAAGEVVQRPASVVKELMENSVDAGASWVRLSLRQAGKSLVQVVDDGCGMTEMDARMAFERHATSKIHHLQDLFSLYTYGFRGEALASIAAVAQVEMKTRAEGRETGLLLSLEGGKAVRREAVACEKGTSIAVRNLFFNVPARRNFLKSRSVELRHISDEFFRVAMAYPHIGFTMKSENEWVYQLQPGSLRQRIVQLFGRKYDEGLVPISEETSILKTTGFVGKPELARKSRGEQFFFVNHRYVRHPYLHHAVAEAFGELLPEDTHPFYALSFEIEPQRVDINVHPTKTEVKFEDERAIYAMLAASVRRALSQHQVAPSLNFEQQDHQNPALQWMEGPSGEAAAPARRSSSATGSGPGREPQAPSSRSAVPQDWKELYEVLRGEAAQAGLEPTSRMSDAWEEESSEEALPAKAPQQLLRKFIVAPLKSGMLIVHQHRAHQRILYERYQRRYANTQGHVRQQLLFPQSVALSGRDAAWAEQLCAHLKYLGFEVGLESRERLTVTGVPASMEQLPLQAFVDEVVETLDKHGAAEPEDDGLYQRLLAQLVQHAAVKTGQSLHPAAMRELIDQLFACDDPYRDPQGRPAVVTVSGDDIERYFG
jgi:DNA mismatch repair protein MutL